MAVSVRPAARGRRAAASVQPAARRAALQLLAPRPEGLVFLVGNSVFTQTRGHPPVPAGRLSDHLLALAGAGPPGSGPHAAVFREAHSYATQMPELRFVLWELIPLLRSLGSGRSSAAFDPPDLSDEFRGLEQRAADFLSAIGGGDAQPDLPPTVPDDPVLLTRLMELLREPCALAGSALVPLEPVRRHDQGDLTVELGGRVFRFRVEAVQPLPRFLQGLSRLVPFSSRRPAFEDPAVRRQAEDFLNLVRPLLSSFGVDGPELRFALLQEGRLKLHHRGGSWVLAYGPARCRTPRHPCVFVGLPIRGRSRRERLAIPHRVTPREDDFFTPYGQAKRGGACMGQTEQYRHLYHEFFTEAEALLHWLDAGVIIATGRSVFHQQWRRQRAQQMKRRAAGSAPRGR